MKSKDPFRSEFFKSMISDKISLHFVSLHSNTMSSPFCENSQFITLKFQSKLVVHHQFLPLQTVEADHPKAVCFAVLHFRDITVSVRWSVTLLSLCLDRPIALIETRDVTAGHLRLKQCQKQQLAELFESKMISGEILN
jgi:hypothetical protein